MHTYVLLRAACAAVLEQVRLAWQGADDLFNGACVACRAVATLQSNQLRGLVAASLTDYLAFFRQHKAVQQLDPQQDSCMWSCKPVFETELVALQGEHGMVPVVDSGRTSKLASVQSQLHQQQSHISRFNSSALQHTPHVVWLLIKLCY
jgi:hypothetical protein